MINRARFTFHDLAPGEESFRDAVLKGLGRTPKSIPCKFFYDARGSALFEAICRLPEYYPTRTEVAILEENAAAIATQIGPHSRLIEFGSGASTKARILLEALDRPAAYVPVDISREHLRDAAISPLRAEQRLQLAQRPGRVVARQTNGDKRAVPAPLMRIQSRRWPSPVAQVILLQDV